MASHVPEESITGRRGRESRSPSTKHKKFLGVSREGRGVDLKIFIE